MEIHPLISKAVAGIVAASMCGQAASADLLIGIDKAAQRMTVTVYGAPLYK